MTNAENTSHDTHITITVQGHEVAMRFAEKPNLQVALQVKQALLGNYLAVNSK